MTDLEYNQIQVIIDHFTNLAEAVTCQTAFAEKTSDDLITHWISRYGCIMSFQSDNCKFILGVLTIELKNWSHIAPAHSTICHSQTNGRVERQKMLRVVFMLRVFCSTYLTDWSKCLLRLVGAYNSTQHATAGINPFMIKTGKERATPLIFSTY